MPVENLGMEFFPVSVFDAANEILEDVQARLDKVRGQLTERYNMEF